ncbi:MAG: SDR family oxidoreductase [Pseudomonadota bacterium]
MRIFLTGATGFIGSRIVPELIAGGHQLLGMTRSESGARALADVGAEAHHATLEDLDSIRAGVEHADAVIHTAFDHDFSNFVANCEKDARVIAAMGEVLRGSNRPLLITSGVGMGGSAPGVLATERVFDRTHPNPRAASEIAGAALLDAGVHVAVVRLPQVHDTERQGLVSPLVTMAREKGAMAYIGEGANRWAAAHVSDVATLYARAIDRAVPGARYHAVAEEGVAARAIAEAIAEGLGIPALSITPDQAPDYFGWMAMFASLDIAASSAWTRAELDWNPTGPGLIEDLRAMDYSVVFDRY